AVNHAFDITDAFVREAGAALDSAARGKFFRQVLLRGMPGAFRESARLINEASAKMAGQAAAIKEAEQKRLKLADRLEHAIQSAAATVAAAATEMRATAEALASTAQRTSQQTKSLQEVSRETSAMIEAATEAVSDLEQSFAAVVSEV